MLLCTQRPWDLCFSNNTKRVDCAAIMGHLGGPVLAGVGLGSILCGSTNWIFSFLSVLTIPQVAKYMAQGQKKDACDHIGQAFWVALLVGVSTMILLLTNSPHLVKGTKLKALHISGMLHLC